MFAIPMLLISLALGYWVLTISQNQQKPLDLVGRIIGAIIILAAVASLLCTAFCKARGGSCGSMVCGMKSAAHCPGMGAIQK